MSVDKGAFHSSYQRRRGTPPLPTRPVQVAIGERRRPQPFGQPGWVRVDTVHQGDLDGIKGLYHVNLVDEVTQFQCIGSVEHIHAACLAPVLDALEQAEEARTPDVPTRAGAGEPGSPAPTRVVTGCGRIRTDRDVVEPGPPAPTHVVTGFSHHRRAEARRIRHERRRRPIPSLPAVSQPLA